jgi:penicillin-binding protein A
MNMNTSIVRLMFTFLGLFLVISLVMVNVQVFQAADLQASAYNPRQCLQSNQPLRGTIYDRHGVKLVWSVPDDKAPCGYRRQWNPDAVKAGLAPLIGYFSYRYGTSGVEKTYNGVLSGQTCNTTTQGLSQQLQNAYNHLLHKQVVGCDIYLTIDLKLQAQANALYNDPGNIYGGVCQPINSNPPGSIIVEDPNSGEILTMVSRPNYDPNRILDDNYWNQITNSKSQPLLNRPAQGLYDPGSTFKTVTLAAGLDTGQYQLSTPFSLDDDAGQEINFDNGQVSDADHDPDDDQAIFFQVPGGEFIKWDDYFRKPGSNGWIGIPTPVTLQDGFAYSDNVIFARVAYQLGPDTWLNYVRRFGISTPASHTGPAVAVTPVSFDGTYAQSRAYNPGADFKGDLLAESGFGQGQLLISPLTMAEVTSAMAAGGNLFVPHVLYKQVVPGQTSSDVSPQPSVLYGGAPVVQPATAAAVRDAMRAVYTHGTAAATARTNTASLIQEGGKTGTGQTANDIPQTWLMTMAPASGSTNGQLVVVVMKERSGEGACQFSTVDNIYKCAAADHDWTPPAQLAACPVKP